MFQFSQQLLVLQTRARDSVLLLVSNTYAHEHVANTVCGKVVRLHGCVISQHNLDIHSIAADLDSNLDLYPPVDLIQIPEQVEMYLWTRPEFRLG